MIETVKCNSCGAVYEHDNGRSNPPHVCAVIPVGVTFRKREGHRDESPVYLDERRDRVAVQDADPLVHETHDQDWRHRITRLASEGLGYTVLHDGPRTPEELAPAVVEPEPEKKSLISRLRGDTPAKPKPR